MAKIKLTINDAAASATVEGLLTAEAVGIPVEVAISGDRWAGLTPKLYARNGNTDMEMAVSADGTTSVPWECMIARGVLQLGVDGIADDASVRIPTIWASCGIVRESAADASPGEHVEPTPDIVDQIHALAYNADRKAQDVVNRANAGEFNGRDGRDGADGKPGPVGPVGPRGEPGADYDDTEIKRAQIEIKDDLSQLETAVNGKYTKPESGIPATDLAAGVIPTKLPAPNKLTFTGAATGEFDGTEPLTIDIPQGGGGGSSRAWTLIREVENSAIIRKIDITEDANGDPFGYDELRAIIWIPTADSASGVFYFYFDDIQSGAPYSSKVSQYPCAIVFDASVDGMLNASRAYGAGLNMDVKGLDNIPNTSASDFYLRALDIDSKLSSFSVGNDWWSGKEIQSGVKVLLFGRNF